MQSNDFCDRSCTPEGSTGHVDRANEYTALLFGPIFRLREQAGSESDCAICRRLTLDVLLVTHSLYENGRVVKCKHHYVLHP